MKTYRYIVIHFARCMVFIWIVNGTIRSVSSYMHFSYVRQPWFWIHAAFLAIKSICRVLFSSWLIGVRLPFANHGVILESKQLEFNWAVCMLFALTIDPFRSGLHQCNTKYPIQSRSNFFSLLPFSIFDEDYVGKLWNSSFFLVTFFSAGMSEWVQFAVTMKADSNES